VHGHDDKELHMHDLRLVGVHDDGEHLVLTGPDGDRYLLAVDEALRAAVRRDRAHLGQLQIEIGGGLRPRDVQSRIRAGATAEQVAATAGWPVEKVRRYEGPVLAEREHVADLARAVRLRRRAGGPVSLGTEVTRRLVGRGVDADHLVWDAWRPDDGPWTVQVAFTAGGRDRQARWTFDLATSSVQPADDEARWLSEEMPPGEGPIGTGHLAAVYDVEADGGVAPEHDGGPLDLMSAMRSRRREREARPTPRTRRPHTEGAKTGSADPSHVPGSRHPAGRRRPAPEPLELDPTLLADPPAAHPPVELEAAPAPEPAEVVDRVEPAPPAPGRRPAARWPLADRMRTAPAAQDASDPASAEPAGDAVDDDVQDTGEVVLPDASGAPGSADATTDTGRHRVPSRGRRASVPSWDDIMFGTKKD
jgi:hypothetical protein